jgi:hypothetical protein
VIRASKLLTSRKATPLGNWSKRSNGSPCCFTATQALALAAVDREL